jgi:hypothetical protein
MHLVQVLLPLNDPEGRPFGPSVYAAVRQELTGRFGGMTAYASAPAKGLWKDDDGEVARDDIVVFEVMVDHIDTGWWSDYGERLRHEFDQDELVVRALPMQLLR